MYCTRDCTPDRTVDYQRSAEQSIITLPAALRCNRTAVTVGDGGARPGTAGGRRSGYSEEEGALRLAHVCPFDRQRRRRQPASSIVCALPASLVSPPPYYYLLAGRHRCAITRSRGTTTAWYGMVQVIKKKKTPKAADGTPRKLSDLPLGGSGDGDEEKPKVGH